MRLAPFLGVFLAFGLYFSTQCPPSGSAPQPGTDARACDAGGLVPLAPPAQEKPKPKPSEKGKPRPPSPDALPTYELAAYASGLADLLRISRLA
jgi:hypothetical protein